MHRMQLMIRDWQYQALRAAAEGEGRSISALVREILDRHLSPDGDEARKLLSEMKGIAEGPPNLGRDHDDFLYGRRGKKG